MEIVMGYIEASNSDEFGSLGALLKLVLGALDHVECDALARTHLISAYPKFKDTIDEFQTRDACPADIQKISSQLMIMYKTMIH
jgi:hypothetical protein